MSNNNNDLNVKRIVNIFAFIATICIALALLVQCLLVGLIGMFQLLQKFVMLANGLRLLLPAFLHSFLFALKERLLGMLFMQLPLPLLLSC